MTGSSYVYFIQAVPSGHIKIGYSANPEGRLRTLKTACAENLRLLGVVPGEMQDERAIHAAFKTIRLHGEWFSPATELLAFIDSLFPKSELITAREIMARVGCSRSFVQDHRAELGARKVSGLLRFPRAEVEAWIARSRLADSLPAEQPEPTPIRPDIDMTGLPEKNPLDGSDWNFGVSR